MEMSLAYEQSKARKEGRRKDGDIGKSGVT